MTKYNSFFKQQVIEFYLQNGKNRSLTRQHFQLEKTTLRLWINQYQHYGIKGLAVRQHKQVYSPEFKLAVIQAVKNGQYAVRQAALKFGLPSPSLIVQWLNAFEKQGINGLQPKPKGRFAMKPKYAKMPPKTEEDRLRWRILELEAEVAYLKKLDELIREQEERQKRFNR